MDGHQALLVAWLLTQLMLYAMQLQALRPPKNALNFTPAVPGTQAQTQTKTRGEKQMRTQILLQFAKHSKSHEETGDWMREEMNDWATEWMSQQGFARNIWIIDRRAAKTAQICIIFLHFPFHTHVGGVRCLASHAPIPAQKYFTSSRKKKK